MSEPRAEERKREAASITVMYLIVVAVVVLGLAAIRAVQELDVGRADPPRVPAAGASR